MDSVREVNDGKLTLEGFSVAARSFSDKWKEHNQSFPPWSWVPLINRTLLVSNKEEGYLSLENIFILSSVEESAAEESLDVTADCSEKEESFDHTILVHKLFIMSYEEWKFRESMTGFLETAVEEIKKIETKEGSVVSALKEITEYFHGDSAKEEAQLLRVFEILRDFVSILDKVCKEMEVTREERTLV